MVFWGADRRDVVEPDGKVRSSNCSPASCLATDLALVICHVTCLSLISQFGASSRSPKVAEASKPYCLKSHEMVHIRHIRGDP